MVRNLHLAPSVRVAVHQHAHVLTMEIPLTAHTAHWPCRVSLSLGALLVTAGFVALVLSRDVVDCGTVVIWTFGEMLLLPTVAAYLTDPRRPASGNMSASTGP
jgi:hypothetical protein